MENGIHNLLDGNIPVGTWNKYNSKNPIQNFLVWMFFRKLRKAIKQIKDELDTALDIGCGEGRTTRLIYECGIHNVKGCDFSDKILLRAKEDNPEIYFFKEDIYNVRDEVRSDLVTACEVLEHLENPDLALKNLSMATKKYCLLSVPDEPLFRILNFCGGKYWRTLGNPLGHLNHWSKNSFSRLVKGHFEILKIQRSIPWIIVLVKPKF